MANPWTGRGTVGKTPVAGTKDRSTNRVSAAVAPDTSGPTLRGFVGERAADGATVSEFAGRHNIRSLGTMDQMAAVAQGMVGKRLRYADLVA